MTTYTWATTLPNPVTFNRALRSNGGALPSAFTGDVQTVARLGERWVVSAEWVNLTDPGRSNLLAYLERLNGNEHRALLPDWLHNRQGSLGGTPLVKTLPAVGATVLEVKGGSLSITDWAKRGDMFRFGTSPTTWTQRRVLADADTDGAGDVTLEFRPAIRTPPAVDDPVWFDESDGPHGLYMLLDFVDYSHSDVLASGAVVSSLSATFLDVGQ